MRNAAEHRERSSSSAVPRLSVEPALDAGSDPVLGRSSFWANLFPHGNEVSGLRTWITVGDLGQETQGSWITDPCSLQAKQTEVLDHVIGFQTGSYVSQGFHKLFLGSRPLRRGWYVRCGPTPAASSSQVMAWPPVRREQACPAWSAAACVFVLNITDFYK